MISVVNENILSKKLRYFNIGLQVMSMLSITI